MELYPPKQSKSKKKHDPPLCTKLICIFQEQWNLTQNLSLFFSSVGKNLFLIVGCIPRHHFFSQMRDSTGFFGFLSLFFEQITTKIRFGKKLFLRREKQNLPPRGEICISKNMALTPYECRSGPCFYFFRFLCFYANFVFHVR